MVRYFTATGKFMQSALIVLLPVMAYGQTDTLSGDIRASVTVGKPETEKHSVFAGLGAGSNLIYLGASISNNKPFYAASLTYGFKNTIYITGSASHLPSMNPYAAFYNLSANYSHTFNSWFDLSADISGYKAAESLRDSLFSDFCYLNLTAGFDWKLLYTKVSFSEILSGTDGFYLQISNSRYFGTPDFFEGKSMVSFDPDIDLLIGTLTGTQAGSGMKRYGYAPPFSRLRQQSYGLP